MAVTVAYNAYDSTTGTTVVSALQGIYNWIAARPETFTVVASNSIGSSSGWFVFKMVGHPWELWLGAATTTPTWSASNAKRLLGGGRIWACFAPGGGWNAATNTPNTANLMFTSAPANSGRCGKIDYGVYESSSDRHAVTFVYDTTVGFFHILHAYSVLSTWKYALSVVPFISNMAAASDPYPWGLFHGQASVSSSSYYWMNNDSSTNVALGSGPSSCVVKPTRTAMQDGGAVVAFVTLDGTNQPNPVGSYDWMPIPVRNNMNGEGHVRGFIDSRAIRQIPSNLTDRTFLGSKSWITVAYDNSTHKVAVPWDGVTNV